MHLALFWCTSQCRLVLPPSDRATPRGPLSCSPNRLCFRSSVRHRRFLLFLLNCTSQHPAARVSVCGVRSGAPCSPPRSATGCFGCSLAAPLPPRRISPSDPRGSITGTPAWSGDAVRRPATGKIAYVPSSLVCTGPRPPQRSSLFRSRRSPRLRAPFRRRSHAHRYAPRSLLSLRGARLCSTASAVSSVNNPQRSDGSSLI